MSHQQQMRDAAMTYARSLVRNAPDEIVALSKQNSDELSYGGRAIARGLHPFVIDEADYAAVMDDAAVLARALLAVVRTLKPDAILGREVLLPPIAWELLPDALANPFNLVGRFDGFWVPGRGAQFIEYNPTSTMCPPAGIANTQLLNESFAGTEFARRFAERFPFRVASPFDDIVAALTAAHRARGGEGLPACVVVTAAPPEDEGATSASGEGGDAEATDPSLAGMTEMILTLRGLAARGCPLQFATLDRLEWDGARLVADGMPIDAAMLGLHIDDVANLAADHPLLVAMRRRAVQTIDGFPMGEFLRNKGLFALLSDPSYPKELTAREADAVARCIPWTRRVNEGYTTYGDQRVDLYEFARRNRERLVLKPTGSWGGSWVALGWTMDEAAWDAALRDTVRIPYVIQERVTGAREPFAYLGDSGPAEAEMLFDLDPFVWSLTRAEGCLVRISDRDLMSVTAGLGSLLATFVLSTRAGKP